MAPTRGFTLNEVIISIAVVAVAFLGTISSLLACQKSTGYGQRMTEATGYCRQIAEIIRGRGLAYSGGTLPAAGTPLQTAPADRKDIPIHDNGDFASLPDDPRFTRSITVTRLGNTSYQRNLLRLTVTVYWREGRAFRSVSMSSLARIPLT